MFAVIMAGGIGKRFWPRSREERPKQFLSILDSKTMIQATVDRLIPLMDIDNIYFVLNYDQKELLLEQLPDTPEGNLILEPFGKNTAPCIGLAALHLRRRSPEEVMLVLPSDHFIRDEESFREALLIAEKVAMEQESLVTIGITPDRPATGYGYIQHSNLIREVSGISVYEVKTFAEKPNVETARRFLESGDFLWNSGIFIWKISSIMREIQGHLPELHTGLEGLDQSIGTQDYQSSLERIYRQTRSISIDYGVMEKAQNVSVIKCDIGWNDVGSWDEVYKLTPKDDHGNAAVGNAALRDSRNCFVHCDDGMVGLLGVDDLVVVRAENAVLICHRDKAQDVKDLVEYLKRKNQDEYL